MSDDRHPNERLADSPDPDPVGAEATEPAERPQSRGVTRRSLLGLGTLGAGLLAYTSDYEDGGVTHSIARAATVPDEPLITVGPESDPVGYIFESNGDWVFKHEASGNEFFYNSAQDRWEAGALAIDRVTIGSGPTISEAPSGVLIEDQSPSGVSAAEFTSGLDSNHEKYIFELSDIVPSEDQVILIVEVSTDGGSTWKTGASDYFYAGKAQESSANSVNYSSGGDSKIDLVPSGVGSGSGEGFAGTVKLSNPGNGSLKQYFTWTASYTKGSNGVYVMVSGGGQYTTAEAIDAIRFKFVSGNIASGDIQLNGVVS